MPSKKRKYNARFPAGRIKKIMQTDEEVGKVAQAVPIIISRTLELFVESLLTKAMQVTSARNAKTLSPSHVKQCILAESRFDFLRDLVKNIPDVSAAEEKELMSAENSPNSSRITEAPRRVTREDYATSNSLDLSVQPNANSRDIVKRTHSLDIDTSRMGRTETVTTTIDTVIDLSKKSTDKPRTANFYQETLVSEAETPSVIRVNPTYTPQPSTSYPLDVPKSYKRFHIENNNVPPPAPKTPVTPILNIDFSKNLNKPEFKVLDTAANLVMDSMLKDKSMKKSVEYKNEDFDNINTGNLQIDEDYDT